MSRESGRNGARRSFTPEEKATILRRHLMDKIPVSDLCDEYRIQPTLFYLWQRQALEHLSAALQDGRTRRGETQAGAGERADRRARSQAGEEGRGHRRGVRGVPRVEKKAWGELRQRWVPPDLRDTVVDFVRQFSTRTELPMRWVLGQLGVRPTQFYRWTGRYGRVNTHNGQTPRDHWLTPAERDAILAYYDTHAPEGYRRMTFMMLDADVVAVSPATVYRVLRAAGMLDRWNRTPSRKGTGFVQPLRPHEHWHVDITYVNLAGTFYYLCAVLDGATRFLIHWELRERMTTADVETVIQRARERYPDARPRIISDNGPQFIAKDFKEFIRLAGMTHVRTSPYYPQSNGKLERWHQTLKVTTIRPKAPDSLDAACRMVAAFVEYYNHHRLHSAIGFVTPADRLAGRAEAIWAARDQKLEAARAQRRLQWTTSLTEDRHQGPDVH
ncbi:MAG TPA: IS3 family transposase [Vicinamibacterales bacterium]|nr:IS3 family transposase [Vicinamibacterales bacterium]